MFRFKSLPISFLLVAPAGAALRGGSTKDQEKASVFASMREFEIPKFEVGEFGKGEIGDMKFDNPQYREMQNDMDAINKQNFDAYNNKGKFNNNRLEDGIIGNKEQFNGYNDNPNGMNDRPRSTRAMVNEYDKLDDINDLQQFAKTKKKNLQKKFGKIEEAPRDDIAIQRADSPVNEPRDHGVEIVDNHFQNRNEIIQPKQKKGWNLKNRFKNKAGEIGDKFNDAYDKNFGTFDEKIQAQFDKFGKKEDPVEKFGNKTHDFMKGLGKDAKRQFEGKDKSLGDKFQEKFNPNEYQKAKKGLFKNINSANERIIKGKEPGLKDKFLNKVGITKETAVDKGLNNFNKFLNGKN